jgi:glycosyltransferase involved in cell wall biosynthesis
MAPTDKTTIIAVIPCLNEEIYIGEVVFKALNYVNAVIVVDDGSTDATAHIARKAGAGVIIHNVNQGAGSATRSGFQAALKADASIVVTLDGDGQHNPDEIPALLVPVLNGTADLVVGSRFIAPATNMPRYRKFGIDIITWVYNLGSKVKISDSQSGFRAHSQKLLESTHITQNDFGFSIEILVQARKHGLTIREIPISCLYHAHGSTADPVSHGLRVALSVVWLRLVYELFGRR